MPNAVSYSKSSAFEETRLPHSGVKSNESLGQPREFRDRSRMPSTSHRPSALRDFLRSEAAGGVILMAVAVLAMIVANSPLADSYFQLLHVQTGPVLSEKLGPMTPHLWINDALMAVFSCSAGQCPLKITWSQTSPDARYSVVRPSKCSWSAAASAQVL